MAVEYKNYLGLKEEPVGKERRLMLMSEALQDGTFLPKAVVYKDIDEAFKRWVEESLVLADDSGNEFPTLILFSNQRFSEYTQSWKYTDKNNNILLNFKTITRENNPTGGSIVNKMWNIPGDDRFYLMKKQVVLDDNGTESLLLLKMRQPTAIDFLFKVSVFTTQYESINTFNTLINKVFRSRQAYLQPNGHYMPMNLEDISDESTYSIDNRQFYGQTYRIKVMGYIITEDDYRVEEAPLKMGFSIPMIQSKRNTPDVEIEECEGDGGSVVTITFPEKTTKNSVVFTIDTDLTVKKIETDNLFNNYKIYVNGNETDKVLPMFFKEDDEIKIVVTKQIKNNSAKLLLIS